MGVIQERKESNKTYSLAMNGRSSCVFERHYTKDKLFFCQNIMMTILALPLLL